jgi:signal transduction histidine kinase
MRKPSPFRLSRYVITVPLIGLAVFVTALLPHMEQSPSTLFFAAVALSAWYGGLGPGLWATGLSVLALDYFFVPPVYALGVGLADAVRLSAFVLVSVLISSLDEAWRRLEEASQEENRHKEEFLAVLAHELRTPLATCLHAVEILRLQGRDPITVEQTRQVMHRQLRTITRFINDLLDVARLRLGKLHLSKETMDLVATVDYAVQNARSLIDSRGHRLEVCVPPGPLWLEADPTRLEQILVNLLENAAKYTPPQGSIWLSVEVAMNKVWLRVKDTGVGIDPKVLPHIFARVAQVQSGSQGGLGIGLSLVRDLVELHGGTLTASSEGPGKGSEFTVALPECAGPYQTEREGANSGVVGRSR